MASALFAAFAAGGIFLGCLAVTTLADVLAAEPSTSSLPTLPSLAALPLAPKSKPRPTSLPGASPVPTPEPGRSGLAASPTPVPTPDLPTWRGTDRVTILLLGLDMREDERGAPTRSDTMMLVTVDPVRKRAGILSIPRDLWVPIPGHGENKINTAHFFGEADRPGDGPALARRTVEYNLGVRVNYYARVDFRGFEELIDAVGGITLDVERPIKDDEYPAEDYGIRRIYIPTGLQRLDGAQALRYARSRHSENDFARSRRQQAVLLAARTQVLQPSILPRVPQMVGILVRALKTDVPLTDVLPLFGMARGIPSQSIVSRSIDYTMTVDVNGDGTLLVPDRRKIRAVIDEVFGEEPPRPTATRAPLATATPLPSATPTPAPTPTRPAAPTATATRAAPVTVRVYNGTQREGLAAGTAAKLQAAGYEVLEIGNASRSDHATSAVTDHTRRPGVAAAVARLLGLPASAVRTGPAAGDADVTVILGLDAPAP